MTKWDYRIIGISWPETQSGVAELMARHGADGWELVTIDFDRGWAYFKRPDQSDAFPTFDVYAKAVAKLQAAQECLCDHRYRDDLLADADAEEAIR